MQIQWTKNANHNLDQIEEFITQDNPFAAIDTVIKIIKTVEALSEHPAMGRVGRIHNTRELIIAGTPYIIAYRVKAKNIQILRVLHSSMQWPDIL